MRKQHSFLKLVSNLALGLVLICASTVSAQTNRASSATKTETSPVAPYPSENELLPGKGPMQTWADFPKVWMQRRTEFWQHRQEDHGAIVFLGDSIIQLWNNLARAFPDFKVANRGIGGDTTRGPLTVSVGPGEDLFFTQGRQILLVAHPTAIRQQLGQ